MQNGAIPPLGWPKRAPSKAEHRANGFPPIELKDSTHLYRFKPHNPEVEVQAELSSQIAFKQIGGAKLEPVVPFLMRAINQVSGILERFSGEFIRDVYL